MTLTIRESVNVPGLGSRSFTFEIDLPEDRQVVNNEIRIIVDAVKEFIENGEQLGDIQVGDYIIEFYFLREEDLGEYYRAYYVASIRGVDEPGTECKAVYRIVIDYEKQRVLIQDASSLAGLEQRTPIENIVRKRY